MEKRLQLITLGEPGPRLRSALDFALTGAGVTRLLGLHEARPGPLLFAVELGETGVNMEYYVLLDLLRRNPCALEGCIGGLLVDGEGELYTKAAARELTLSANASGCAFVGRPLVEATGSLHNFHVLADAHNTDLAGAYRLAARELVSRLRDYQKPRIDRPRILTLYASNRRQSNTYALFEMVKAGFSDTILSQEIQLRNGSVADCEGCAYTTCMHFGERGACFYGGVIVDEVYPAIRDCDALMLLCPNYNDAADANITALINRMTALFRKHRFYEKSLFALVVSGYSGGDIVANQLISAMNMNKSFQLPPRFCMLETANDPGSIKHIPGIEKRAGAFAAALNSHLGTGKIRA